MKWTADEIRKVWKLKWQGKSNRQIGEVIGRSGASVHYIVGKTYDHGYQDEYKLKRYKQ